MTNLTRHLDVNYMHIVYIIGSLSLYIYIYICMYIYIYIFYILYV